MVYTQWLLERDCLAEWGEGMRMLEKEDWVAVGGRN